jgi:hypothetical protein
MVWRDLPEVYRHLEGMHDIYSAQEDPSPLTLKSIITFIMKEVLPKLKAKAAEHECDKIGSSIQLQNFYFKGPDF